MVLNMHCWRVFSCIWIHVFSVSNIDDCIPYRSVENINREMNETCATAAANVAQCANEGLVATIEGRRRISSCSGYSTATGKNVFADVIQI